MKTDKKNHESPQTEEQKVQNTPENASASAEKDETTEQAADQIVDEMAELSAKCADLTDKNLRLMAEFDNYRKRTMKEKADLIKSAGENIFGEMLPLIDDFERAQAAMVATTDVQAMQEGIKLIYNKFIAFLAKHDVKPIDTENADFDVNYHEAITTFPAPTPEQKGKIIDCTTKGYTLGDKVIRFAKVVVGE